MLAPSIVRMCGADAVSTLVAWVMVIESPIKHPTCVQISRIQSCVQKRLNPRIAHRKKPTAQTSRHRLSSSTQNATA
ncbi:hypothetical protein GCM10009094_06280 [Massilia aurea]